MFASEVTIHCGVSAAAASSAIPAATRMPNSTCVQTLPARLVVTVELFCWCWCSVLVSECAPVAWCCAGCVVLEPSSLTNGAGLLVVRPLRFFRGIAV